MSMFPPTSRMLRLFARWRSGGRAADRQAQVQNRRLVQMGILNVVVSVLLAIAAARGLAGWLPVIATMSYAWTGLLVFVVLMRSGWSKRRADPTLSFAQLMFSISALVLSYGLLDIARGASLELLCLLLAFAMDRLPTRELLKASLSAVALLALTSVARILCGAANVRADVEVYNLLMAAVLLPVAIIAGGEISRLHRRHATQREELTAALARLKELSLRDGLTGLVNRRHVLQLIEQAHRESLPSHVDYCVAMLDLDWFKRINDEHGHAIGDLVLQKFASVMISALDGRFTLARWGGEEFLLLMPACTLLEAEAVVASCRRTLRQFDWSAKVSGLCLTFSAGLAGSGTGCTFDEVLTLADQGLYLAKANGRDRTEICAAQEKVVAGASPGRVAASHAVPAHESPSEMSIAHESNRHEARSRASDVSSAPVQLRSSRTWQSRLSDVVLSRSTDIRENLRLPLIACVLHAVWLMAVYFYAMPHAQISAGPGWLVIIYECLSAGGFYAAIRCGWSRRFPDGGLVLAQMVAGTVIAAFGYVVAPQLRPSLLHLICVIQVFGMVTLKPAETRLAGVAAIALVSVVLSWLCMTRPPDLDAEVLKLVLAGSVLLQLSILSNAYSTIRERVRDDRLQLERAVVQVEEQITRDPLTGLLNRRYMEQALVEHHAEWLDGGGVYCLGMLDIDHFKRINDERGHHAGDGVLVALARASRRSLRDSDLMCRWGGEEFVWLMRGSASETAARATIQRLRAAFEETCSEIDVVKWRVTFSSGFALPQESMTPDELLAAADRALYQAKRGGRDRDVFADTVDAGCAGKMPQHGRAGT